MLSLSNVDPITALSLLAAHVLLVAYFWPMTGMARRRAAARRHAALPAAPVVPLPVTSEPASYRPWVHPANRPPRPVSRAAAAERGPWGGDAA